MPTTPERSPEEGDTLTRRLATLWGVILLVCGVILALQLRHGLPTDTRLTAMLPEDRQSPLIERAADQLSTGFEERFVLALTSPSLRTDTESLARQLERTTANAQDNGSPLLDDLDWRDTDLAVEDPHDLLGDYRYRLLTDDLRNAIDDDGGESLVDPALRRLFSPAGDPQPVDDPFGLLDAWLDERDGSRIQAHDGLLTVENNGQRHALLIGRLSSHPYDPATQQALTRTLTTFMSHHPDTTLMRSGLVFHAAAGAEQAKREITTIGLGALTGLIIILLAVFRSPRVLLHLLLPLATGLLFALPLTLLIFGRLHLLTLAFGASLIGIAIDYALHLQCHRASQDSRWPIRSLLPGLTLGLISSLMAYLAQALTPLPGLRQMAVFAALGLTGAWLTVILWLSRFKLPACPHTRTLAERLWRWTTPRRQLVPSVAAAAAALLILISASSLTVDDSLQLLNPSPTSLLEEEQRVQQLMDSDTGNRFFVVEASTEGELLSRLADLGSTLTTWQDEGTSLDYDSLTRNVPPYERQDANLARVNTLYGEPLETLVQRADLPEATLERARSRLSDVPRLDLSYWLSTPLGELQQRLWLGETDNDGVAATLVISNVEDATLDGRLTELADRHESVSYVNRADHLSGLLALWREHIAWWVTLAIAALVPIMIWRYRLQAWRVLTPPVGAILGVLALFALTGTPLNVFSQLGLLLVLGIGLDAGIFSVEHARRPSAWLAITLSTLSSILAFGLLSFSKTPALHYMGLSCLTGLAIVWLLVPWSRPKAASLHRETAYVD